MKIVFAGTPEFAAQAMRAIEESGHHIVLALTQPDRRAGRGMHLQASPVKVFAQEKNIPVLQPVTLKQNHTDLQKSMTAQEAFQHLSSVDFDAMVVVAYGLILPQAILDLASQKGRHGCFNIHASVLPRWRGAAPIQRAIESGDTDTGVSIMQMDALMVKTLNDLNEGSAIERTPQPIEGVTYAEKILKSEAEIDWHLSAIEIDRRIRAFNPFPGSTSSLNGEQMKFWNSCLPSQAPIYKDAIPGRVLDFSVDGVYVQCGDGVIEILEMQKPGGKKITASACLQSYRTQEKTMQFQKD
ncbi:MAG: hypothetical protein RLY75_678 [Pseudomonadota bacterium]